MRAFTKFRMTFVAFAAISAGLIFYQGASAHTGATGVVKERMERMKVMRKNIKALRILLRSDGQVDHAELSDIARQMAGQAPHFSKLFPKGSHAAPSEALPAIWEQWDDFLARFDTLKAAADTLSAAQTTGEAKETFARITEICDSCHDKYQADK